MRPVTPAVSSGLHHLGSLKQRAIFLDRDGTLNQDPGYLSSPDLLHLLPGVPEALKRLKEGGFLLVVVSNQSGVGRGLIALQELEKIHSRLQELLAAGGAKIDHFELCIHRPDDLCECRKPKPKLILDAAASLGVNVSRSYMIGDKVSDIEAGANAGCKGVGLVLTGEGKTSRDQIQKEPRLKSPDFIANSLLEMAEWILKQD